jgi:hypothetical protein
LKKYDASLLSASDTLTSTVVVPLSFIIFGSILISEIELVIKLGNELPFGYKQLRILGPFPSGSMRPFRMTGDDLIYTFWSVSGGSKYGGELKPEFAVRVKSISVMRDGIADDVAFILMLIVLVLEGNVESTVIEPESGLTDTKNPVEREVPDESYPA